MTDWLSLDQILDDAKAFDWLMHVLLGLYGWEVVTSLSFDWLYITRKRKLTCSVIFYFACRYSLFIALAGVIIASNLNSLASCHALFIVVELFSHAAISFACIIFAMRTIFVWDSAPWTSVLFIVLTLGHWSLILQTSMIESSLWSKGGCYISRTNHIIQTATFVFSTVLDLMTLILIAIKIPFSGSSIFFQLLRHDTVVYIFVATIFNCLGTVFMFLNLNAVMASMFIFPSAVCSTIMATSCVRAIIQRGLLISPDVSEYTSTVIFGRSVPTDNHRVATLSNNKTRTDELHIQMQTFVPGHSASMDDGVSEISNAADVESQVLPSDSDCEYKIR